MEEAINKRFSCIQNDPETSVILGCHFSCCLTPYAYSGKTILCKVCQAVLSPDEDACEISEPEEV